MITNAVRKQLNDKQLWNNPATYVIRQHTLFTIYFLFISFPFLVKKHFVYLNEMCIILLCQTIAIHKPHKSHENKVRQQKDEGNFPACS